MPNNLTGFFKNISRRFAPLALTIFFKVNLKVQQIFLTEKCYHNKNTGKVSLFPGLKIETNYILDMVRYQKKNKYKLRKFYHYK